MNIIKEWVYWKMFRPRGKFRGYWNMTEEELKEENRENIVSALKELAKIYSIRGWMIDGNFFKMIMVEFKKAGKKNLDIQLKLKNKDRFNH